ncbi:carboxylating nicotinate-nucleotide diphosphorylase [Planococcaceae bacterium Storch 2/2-2]|nr:carboxylating nicotinate-nucleotide diphosphorylase [Planococcaceae bacterium Storch 2/2-2]
MLNRVALRERLTLFYNEDVGTGDVSAQSIFDEQTNGSMDIIAKDDGIFCGRPVIEEGFRLEQTDVNIDCFVEDGDRIERGDVVARLHGPVRTLLTTERLVLNCIQRMSAIATETARLVRLMNSETTKLADTRKTMPGFRMLDKYAVRVGGGHNHRYGLYDAVMLKDNHIAFAGSIADAVARAREAVGHTVPIEVEIETKEQLLEAIDAHPDIIMFDNRTPEEIIDWIELVPETIRTEASGMITEETIAEYGKTGVDYISVGALTHSVRAFDFSANVTVKD